MERKRLVLREAAASRLKVLKCADSGIELLTKANHLVEHVDEQFFALENDNMSQFIRIFSFLKNTNINNSKKYI